MFELKDIYWEVRPVFFISKFVGLSPYTERFHLSAPFVVITAGFILFTFLDSMVIMIGMEGVNGTFQMSAYSLILERVQLLMVGSTMIMSMIISIANAKPLSRLMESFLRADKDLRSVGVFVDPSRKFGIIFVTLRMSVVFAILVKEAQHTVGSFSSMLVQYIILAPLAMAYLSESQFMVLVNAIKLRITTMIADMKDEQPHRYHAKSKKLLTFVTVHSFLVESCSAVNSLYAVQILMIISSVFVNTTANLYHVIEKTINLIEDFHEADLLTLTVTASRVIFRSYEVWSVVATCFETQERARICSVGRMKGIKDVYRELRPVFFLSKLLGLAPYNYHLQLSAIWCSITFVMIILTAVATGVCVTAPFHGQSTFSLILDRGQTLLLGFTSITALAKSPVNAAALTTLGRLFVKVDMDLKSVGVFVSHSFRFGLLGIVVRCVILLPVLFLGLYIPHNVNVYLFMTEYVDIMSQLTTFVIEMQFMTLANCVRTRVATMAKHLNAIAAKPHSYKPKKLVVLSSCHSSLVDMTSTINDLYTVQMLFIMFTIFLLATANLYELIEAITTKTKILSSDIGPLLLVTLKVFLRSFEIWTITTVCVEAQENIKEFNSVLYQVLIEDESGVLAENKKLQLHVSMKKEVEFSAYNFFPIDYTLVHSMVSAATTYLVILIQFSSISQPTTAPPTTIVNEQLLLVENTSSPYEILQ